jgi:UDP-glucose 4-epimerase
MRVLVTGGAGFIGSHLTDALIARGDQVTVVDDLSAGRIGRLHQDADFHIQDITGARQFVALAEAVKPALICHLAAQIDVRASVTFPATDSKVNVTGTVNVLEAALAVGARVLFSSTGGAIYGRGVPIPSPETAPTMPESPYGTAKYCAEQYIGLFNRLHGTSHGILRFANVYGPRQDPAGEGGVVGIFCSRAWAGQPATIFGDGRQTRDFVYVADVVDAILAAADCDQPGVWNVGTGTEVSVLRLASLVAEVSGRTTDPEFAPARPGELDRSALSAELAARELGWRPATTLADGVAAVYRWIESGAHDRIGTQGTALLW